MSCKSNNGKHRKDEGNATQSGRSRKNHRVGECGLNKALANDVLRQARQIAIIYSDDAVQCDDRIVHTIARQNVDPYTCGVIIGTLAEMEHYVSTSKKSQID